MTYFSRFEINPQRRESRRLLGNPQALHASVLTLFPPSQGSADRVLWRLDSEKHKHTLYVVSPEKPDFSHLNETAGWNTSLGQSLDYTRFLQRVQHNTDWLFRLQANPTKSEFSKAINQAGKRGKVRPLVREDEQLKWLLARGEQNGFQIVFWDEQELIHSESHPPEVRILENSELVFYKNDGEDNERRKVTLRKVVYEGKLKVVDELKFRQALLNGIGRAKSYGNGLITLKQ